MAAEQQVDQHRHRGDEASERREGVSGHGSHAAPEGAGLHPLIDLSRDPNPGVPNHAAPDDD